MSISAFAQRGDDYAAEFFLSHRIAGRTDAVEAAKIVYIISLKLQFKVNRKLKLGQHITCEIELHRHGFARSKINLPTLKNHIKDSSALMTNNFLHFVTNNKAVIWEVILRFLNAPMLFGIRVF